ncbi:hypothetical protein JCM3766R1_002363 [Sporobolomyces carnicolor]
MTHDSPNLEFRLGRLRFIRLPPTNVLLSLDKTQSETAAFDIGVGITDDYGADIELFQSIDLRLEVFAASSSRGGAKIGLKLASDDSRSSTFSPSLDFTFSPLRGPFHGLSIKLTVPSTKTVWPTSVRFRLSVAPQEATNDSSRALESTATTRIRQIIGEEDQGVLETWNDLRYVFLAVETGDVELVRKLPTSNPPVKVQTTHRRITVPSRSPITIVERPGLNNSTGQRLWDCAIGLSAFFSLHPEALQDCYTPVENSADRLAQLHNYSDGESSVVATDIEATVETTLSENLSHNEANAKVARRVLNWGTLSDSHVKDMLDCSASVSHSSVPSDLTLIASDVLYDPDTHQLLLDTLLSFLRPSPSVAPLFTDISTRALIAYKRRTDGDDGFFALAKEAGLNVGKIWEWSEVSVWSFA